MLEKGKFTYDNHKLQIELLIIEIKLDKRYSSLIMLLLILILIELLLMVTHDTWCVRLIELLLPLCDI